MTATILFLYANGSGWCARQCELETAEEQIRYWLDKSPGIHGMDRIWVIPAEGTATDWTNIQETLRIEQVKHAEQLREKAERALYDRLKRQFES